MITLDAAKQLLERQKGIEGIEACKNQYLRARFANRISPKNPLDLVVHPITEKLVLRILVPSITKVNASSGLPRVLCNLNYDILMGKIGIDARDGEVAFEINHPCRDGNAEDPGPEVFARLIDVAMSTANEVALISTHVGMVDAGVPDDVARQFMAQFKAKEEQEDESEDSL